MATTATAVTDTVYNKVFNTAERTFKMEGLIKSWQDAAAQGFDIKVYDISGNHIETLGFRNVIHNDTSFYDDIEEIVTRAAHNLQSYASVKQDIISAFESKVYTCDETHIEEGVTASSTPLEIALPAKVEFIRTHATYNERELDHRDFIVLANKGTSRKPLLDLHGYEQDSGCSTRKVAPRNIALYQAQLALLDDTAEVNSEALELTARTAAIQEREIEERKRKTNMLMLMGMFG